MQDRDGETLRCRFVSGTDADIIERVVVKTGEGLAGWVARTRRPLINASPRLDTTTATRLNSALVTPLLFQERFVGTLAVYHEQADFYSEDHGRLLSGVASQDGGGRRQLAAVRPGAGGLAHGAPEHPVALHAPDT